MNASNFVTLAGGLTVPLPALQVLWNLEDRGVYLRLDGDGIIATPRTALTDADRATVKRWRAHVVALLQYCQQQRETVQ
jgi:hypothetical protein